MLETRKTHKQSNRQKKQAGPAREAGGGTWNREFVQGLEARTLLSAASVVISPNVTLESASPSPTASTITGYTPSQISSAYGFSSLASQSDLGHGQTIAIVDAYNDPNIVSDLGVFDSKFGLSSPPSFKVVNQTGGSTLPATNAGWAGEISLDVEWAHALAPDASIVLVEASSSSLTNLLAGVKYASTQASVVSMSWGGSEFSGEAAYDSYFTTPGVTYVAASGDQGSFDGPEWPAVSPNVIGVGGTSLTINSNGTYGSETAWNDSTGGTSEFETLPAYQSVIPSADTEATTSVFNQFGGFGGFGGFGRFGGGGTTTTTTSNRSAPDVAFDANPNTGVAVYDSIPDEGYTGWQEVGGTSVGAPSWGALIAIADQSRVAGGLGTLSGASQTLTTLYSLYSAPGTSGYTTYSSTFHDVTSGGSRSESATAGYDQLTGLGSPQVVQIVTALSSGKTATTPVSTSPASTPVATTPAFRRWDVAQPVPPSVQAAPATVTEFASSPLQEWTAIENQFALADTTPSTLVPVSASELNGYPSNLTTTSLELSRVSFAGTASLAHDVVAEATEAGLVQWPPKSLQTLIQASIGLVETTVAANLPQSITHMLSGDAASKITRLFATAPVETFVAPLVAELPGRVLGLTPALFAQHIDSDAGPWKVAAATGLAVTLAGCLYLNAARREEKELAPALRLRRLGDGWELTPLEER